MKFRVTAAAAADVRSIVEYLSVESPLAKSRFEARLDAVLVNIRERPLMGRRTDRRLTRVMNTYPFPYLIYYRIKQSEILVLRVLHGARNPRSMPARPG